MQQYGYQPYQDPYAPVQAQQFPIDPSILWMVVGAAIVIAIGTLVLIQIVKQFLYVAQPNEALVFSGKRYKMEDGTELGYRIVKGGHRAFRIPILEKVDRLDMTIIPIDIVVENAYSRGNIPLQIHAIANVKVHGDLRWIRNAVERFLGRGQRDIQVVAQQTLEGALREVLAQLSPEEVNTDRLKFAEKLIHAAEDDLQKLGLALDTLKIQSVSDQTGYLDSIGRPVIAAALRDAENAESQAAQETQQAQAEATRRAEVARATAQMVIQQKQNQLRTLKANLEGEAQAVEREAEAAAKTARAMAERQLQEVRAALEGRRLQAEVVIPAEFQRQAQQILAKGAAAPTAENGAAAAEILALMSDAWQSMGPQAREIYVIQHLEEIVGTVVRSLENVSVDEVNVLDQGDGSALASYAATYPKMVAAVMSALRETTGVDVPAILGGDGRGNGASQGRA
ncbi:flotillin family protein [Sandaracinus amylolyticus]|uniref:Inner membrane protein YqiK n=1 Tax=Sandaracinus amylolyticus TaxID=927083 RepID=A0A0F6YM93_9BACT|nr:flotillin family protein [Sandaracinus amylolyticus]AKF10726.1 Inner membrane protein YqiK [Sandaracinus amylolyticus]